MTYKIAYARENENMCEIKRVVILIHPYARPVEVRVSGRQQECVGENALL